MGMGRCYACSPQSCLQAIGCPLGGWMLEHLTNAKLQLALAGALTVVLVSLMIPVAICVRGLTVPVHACTQAAGLVSQGWHKQYPRQASTVAASAPVSRPTPTVQSGVDVTSSTPS